MHRGDAWNRTFSVGRGGRSVGVGIRGVVGVLGTNEVAEKMGEIGYLNLDREIMN
jgi:hypothetical protein